MRRLLVVALFALVVAPAAPASEEEPFPRAVVVGIGNRVSGRIAVGIVGEKGCPWHVAFREAAKQIEARTDLRVEVSVTNGMIPRPGFTFRSSRQPENGRSVEQAVEAIRNFILRNGDVAYYRTAFAPLVRHYEDGKVHLTVNTLLPGEVDLSVLSLTGAILLPPGRVRRIDLDGILDVESALVRLRFEGEGSLRDEVRYWLPDLLPGGTDRIRVEGARSIPAGEPVFLRVVIDGPDWRSRTIRPVRVTVSDRSAQSVTGVAGVATVTLPAFGPDELGRKSVTVRVGEAPFQRTLAGSLSIVQRKATLVVTTDRPVYRPGGEVRVRVLAVDSVSRAAIAGREVGVAFRDPRDRLFAGLSSITGVFGEATFELPLADGIAEGRYRIEATGAGATAKHEFRVEEIRRLPFELRLIVDGETAIAGEPIRARVTARTFTGDPLTGARVDWSVAGGGDRKGQVRLGPDGTAALVIPPEKPEHCRAVLRVVVTKAGARATAERSFPVRPRETDAFIVDTRPSPLVAGVPGEIRLSLRGRKSGSIRFSVDEEEWRVGVLRGKPVTVPVALEPWAKKLRIRARATLDDGESAEVDLELPVVQGGVIEAPDVLRPGSTERIRFRATIPEDPVILDLYHDGRLVSSATGHTADGVTAFDLPVRGDLGGPALLSVGPPASPPIATQGVRIGVRNLRVNLDVSPVQAEPGAEVTLDARVTGDGGGRAALLEVRAFDRAYLDAVGGVESPLPRRLNPAATRPGDPLIVEYDPALPLALLDEPAARAARSALGEALENPEAVLRVPWGAGIHRWHEAVTWETGPTRVFSGRYVVVGAEPPVTARPGREGRWPMAQVVRWKSHAWSGDAWRFPVLLPAGTPARGNGGLRRRRAVESGLGWWLSRHQGPGGSWHPHGFAYLCEEPACGGRGDPRLHPGSTALAVLAYLGAGETHRHGRHKKRVMAGLRFLRAAQRPDGFIGDPEAPCAMLNHAMATLAMTEAYAMTGSPLFKGSAKEALVRLRAAQDRTGGFRETSFPRGSLALTGWATLAFKSGKAAGIPEIEPVLTGAREFVLARRDRTTRVVPATTEEMATYPFRLGPGSGAPEAITAAILLFTRTGHREELQLPAIPAPTYPAIDMHAVYWGALAAFDLGGQTWKDYSAAMKAGIIDLQRTKGCARGSWDPEGGPLGRIATTALGTLCLEFYYRYGRVFGNRQGGGPAARVRRDFPDLALANLAIRTDADGRATLPFRLPDSITTWEVLVGAWDGRGGYAVGRGAVRSTLPLAVEGEVPTRITVGDVVTIPIRVRSRLEAEAEVRIEYEVEGGLAIAPPVRKIVFVPPGDVRALPIQLNAIAAGDAVLRIRIEGSGEADAWERRVAVLPARVPFVVAKSVSPGEAVDLSDVIPADARSLTAVLEIGGGAGDDVERALHGLIRRPTGCFEQTAATVYPMLMAIQYLERTRFPGKEVREDARRHLMTGYQRLLGFETPEEGFSLYGEKPATAALTALGVHILSDLGARMEVDPDVRERAARRLRKQLPSDPAERVYAVAALSRAGVSVPMGFPRWLAGIEDPYVLALATVHGLVPASDLARVREILGRDRFRTKSPTLFAGHATNRTEVIAIVALALRGTGGDPVVIAEAVAELRRRRRPDAAWSTTRATVAALRTLIECDAAEPVSGPLRVKVDGVLVTDARVETLPGHLLPLGVWSRSRRLRLDFEGTGRPDLRIVVRGSSVSPPAAEQDLAVSVTWPATPVPAGIPFIAKVEVAGRSSGEVHAPMVVVPLPGGCRVDRSALDEAARGSSFSRVLVREGRVELYLTRVRPEEEAGIALPLIPEFRGRVTPNPARAYPYYEPERMSLAPGKTITVE